MAATALLVSLLLILRLALSRPDVVASCSSVADQVADGSGLEHSEILLADGSRVAPQVLAAVQSHVLARSFLDWKVMNKRTDRLGLGMYASSIALAKASGSIGHFNFECNEAPTGGVIQLDSLLNSAWEFDACPDPIHTPPDYSMAAAVAKGIHRDKAFLLSIGVKIARDPYGKPVSWDEAEAAFQTIADTESSIRKQNTGH